MRDAVKPAETLLVVDAMTGQDAVNTARAFNEKIGYPSKWRDYSAVRIARDDWAGNVARASEVAQQRQLRWIGTMVDRSIWLMAPWPIRAIFSRFCFAIVLYPPISVQPAPRGGL